MKKIDVDNMLWGLLVSFTFLTIIVYFTYDIWAVQVLSACLGAIITIIATRLLLSSQSKIDEKRREEEDNLKREFEIYNAKLKVYSDFVSKMYNALSDNHITSAEFIDLRTRLFASIGFYAQENVLVEINQLFVKYFFDEDGSLKDVNIDSKMSVLFSGITNILQNDTKAGKRSPKNSNENQNKDIVQTLWRNFEEIIQSLKNQEKQDEDLREKEKNEEQREKDIHKILDDEEIEKNNENKQSNINGGVLYLEKQAWHFNAWGDSQFKQFEDLDESKEYELSLIEYGEYWRTNILKQVEGGDFVMLFRRGGYGYVGAFKAIGRRIFDFEKGEEEILYFDNPEKLRVVSTKDNYDTFEADTKECDIYKSKEDGASLCSNLIVKCIAYVPDGVGNPGGVYRRTISRYDSHYAWLLKERFQKKGQWNDSE